MTTLRRRLVLGFAWAALGGPALARADLPPPQGYVETCTVEKQCKTDEECRSCSANYQKRDACEKTLGAEGFARRCRTGGASVWTEIWARAKPKPPAPPKK